MQYIAIDLFVTLMIDGLITRDRQEASFSQKTSLFLILPFSMNARVEYRIYKMFIPLSCVWYVRKWQMARH